MAKEQRMQEIDGWTLIQLYAPTDGWHLLHVWVPWLAHCQGTCFQKSWPHMALL